MANATANITTAQNGLGARLAGLREAFILRMERRRVFKQTFNELSALSNRDLADLGLARSEIRRVAWQAANDI